MDSDTRVDHLWFSSDTLVLRAETKIFRVPKSILAGQSSVFRDMAAFPQHQDGDTEMMEESPVVNLSDSATDVEAFLSAIFDSSYFMPPPARVKLDAVLGVLRLAHKYDVQYLYTRALERLSIQYGPRSLNNYLDYLPDRIDDNTHADPVNDLKIIHAVTEVGALWLLPIAHYRAATAGADRLRQAAALEADEAVVQRCLAAYSGLRRGTGAMTTFLTLPSTPSCTSQEKCNHYRLTSLYEYFCEQQKGADLMPLDVWNDDAWSWNEFCDPCKIAARSHHDNALLRFWDELPPIFGLPPWQELNIMRTAALHNSESV
ncbi:hypothetical protein DFH06DRAFT_1107361 [Mycena polygramma]|nr:hypothetical protein DFH06DRAFT_1107361 [Mycena polygramma]